MKKLSVLLIICMIVCALPLTSLADAVSVSDEGVVTYSNDFENETVSTSNCANDKNGIHYATSGNTKFIIRGNNTRYLELQQTVADKYPSLTVNLLKTDAAPKINSLANAKKYKVTFRMRVSPKDANKTQLYMDCGARWSFFINKSGTTYNIFCNNKAVSAEVTQAYSCTTTFDNNSDNNAFRNYEISIDKSKDTPTADLKVDGTLIFKDAPLYTGCSFDYLKFTFQKTLGRLAIDDIKVTVMDTVECNDENYASATNINFDNFGIGMIPNNANTNIGGFENDNEQTGYAYIDYTYKSENPSEVNKFLKITKNKKETKPFSIKRDISGVVGDYSVYDVSFKIKNGLGTASTESAFIRLADGSNSNNGAVISIRGTDGKIGWFDYSTGAGVSNISEKTAAAGEWTEIKARVYKDENKADLYVGDMENPIAQNIKTNRKTIGDYIVFAPQKSAVNSSISVDDIVIKPVTKSDYVLTYTTDSDDLAKYTSNGVSAQCKITNESAQIPVIIIAEYGADGRLVNIAKSESAQNGTISATLSSAGAQTGENVSVMLWKSLDDPVPLKKLIKLSPVVQ